ncbi:MAG: hypothetical protein AB1700_01505 [Bacillota bacterium]
MPIAVAGTTNGLSLVEIAWLRRSLAYQLAGKTPGKKLANATRVGVAMGTIITVPTIPNYPVGPRGQVRVSESR